MSKCANCGAESFRVRTIFHESHGHYVGQTDECPSCAPGSFEPTWLRERLVPAYEAYPQQYRKTVLPDGQVCYVATEESRADEEARIMRACPEDEASFRKRRKYAAAQPKRLTSGQIESANRRKADILAKLRERGARV